MDSKIKFEHFTGKETLQEIKDIRRKKLLGGLHTDKGGDTEANARFNNEYTAIEAFIKTGEKDSNFDWGDKESAQDEENTQNGESAQDILINMFFKEFLFEENKSYKDRYNDHSKGPYRSKSNGRPKSNSRKPDAFPMQSSGHDNFQFRPNGICSQNGSWFGEEKGPSNYRESFDFPMQSSEKYSFQSQLDKILSGNNKGSFEENVSSSVKSVGSGQNHTAPQRSKSANRGRKCVRELTEKEKQESEYCQNLKKFGIDI